MSEIQALSNLVERLEKAVSKLETCNGGGQSSSSVNSSRTTCAAANAGASPVASTTTNASISMFDCMVAEYLEPYYELSNKIGGPLVKQADLFKQLVSKQRYILECAANCQKPADDVLSKWFQNNLATISEQLTSTSQENKSTNYFLNLCTVSEAAPMFLWNFFSPTPASYIHEIIGSSEFHSNKLCREHKDKNSDQIQWVTKFNGFLKAFEAFIKKNYTTGITWNGGGQDFLNFAGSSLSMNNTAVAPSVPQAKSAGPFASADQSSHAKNDLFSQLNKGSNITSGLKKVTADMKSKNRADRSGVVSSSGGLQQTSYDSKKSSTIKALRTPKCELQGNRWVLEHVKGSVNVNITEMKQTVYVYNSEQADIIIKGKFNALTVDSAKKTNIVFDEAVSSIEIVNSSSLQIQVLESVPSVVIDKSSGVVLYLSKKSLSTQIVTSKSDCVNVSIPGATTDAEPSEIPVPEQFLSYLKDGKLITVPNSHLGE